MDLIEKMAKANYELVFEKPWENLPERTREVFYDAMWFAVKELRTPTDEMIDASWGLTSRAKAEIRMQHELADSKESHRVKMKHRWTAMIDKLLEATHGETTDPSA